MIKRFVKYYRPHIGLFIIDLVCAFVLSGLDLVFPTILRKIIDQLLPAGELNRILMAGVILLLINVVKMVLEYIVTFWGHVLGLRMEYNMRKELFTHLHKLSFNFFDNTKTGYLMSRVVNDLGEISELAHHGPEDIFISIVMITGSVFILISYNWKLALLTFVMVPLMVVFAYKYNSKMHKAFRMIREKIAEINARVEESIAGVRVVKSFNNEDLEAKKIDEANKELLRSREYSLRTMGEFFSGINFLTGSINTFVLISAAVFVYRGELTIGELVGFLFYINLFLNPVRRLLNFTEAFQRGMAGFRRFTEILDLQPEISDKPDAIVLSDVKGDIDFKNVTFSYNERKTVLSNINFTVKAGETVALVGPSGAGKTTICNLIPRFYEIDRGRIAIDGIDNKNITLKSLRDKIGLVQQDVFLFSGTIRENIIYGRLDATEEEMVEAAKDANAHQFIMELPQGYDTVIGERGIKLSGGQKQRISIARMFLKNPPILILDEATSSLDNESERIIQDSIKKLSFGRTTFIIAHRLTTIRNADTILVLTDNGIEEQGTHQELLAKNGVYAGLYKNQFGDEE